MGIRLRLIPIHFVYPILRLLSSLSVTFPPFCSHIDRKGCYREKSNLHFKDDLRVRPYPAACPRFGRAVLRIPDLSRKPRSFDPHHCTASVGHCGIIHQAAASGTGRFSDTAGHDVALCLLFWKRTPETVATFIALGSCVFLTLKCGRRIPEKIIPLILSGTMGMYILIFSVLGSIGVRIPVQSLPSPDGSRCARIINSDQGATGGDTLVEVVEETNLLLYRVEKRQRVYVGPWGHWEAMQIRWKNDYCLVIDGTEYEV